jgi:hypothetical protein
MDKSLILWIILVYHFYFCIRFTVKAVQGDIDNYSFKKMAIVVLLPFIGYYWMMQEQEAQEEAS